ncbi:hypothetical protein F4778DRAFT_778945 [Xylariomycetidae sp. FL2044]|nr:hypothetical protein F4778DRAFT_778945 [Xylariomycetidae sp. FL2044]
MTTSDAVIIRGSGAYTWTPLYIRYIDNPSAYVENPVPREAILAIEPEAWNERRSRSVENYLDSSGEGSAGPHSEFNDFVNLAAEGTKNENYPNRYVESFAETVRAGSWADIGPVKQEPDSDQRLEALGLTGTPLLQRLDPAKGRQQGQSEDRMGAWEGVMGQRYDPTALDDARLGLLTPRPGIAGPAPETRSSTRRIGTRFCRDMRCRTSH